MKNFIINFLESGHHFSNRELSLKFKYRLLNTIMLIIVFTSTAFVAMYYLGLSPIGAFHTKVNIAFALINLLLIISLRHNKSYYGLINSLMLLSSLLTFTSALVNIPGDEFRMMWFYITVLLAFFTGGLLLGYITAAASILIILIANTYVNLNLSSLAITTAITGLVVLTIAVKAYTQKMLDLEASLIALNDSLQTKVQEAVEDIRKKDEAMLQQSRLAKMGEMIAMIAHQWRQPLSSIAAISSKLQLAVALDEEISNEALLKELTTIDKRTALLSKTIDDFRDFYTSNKEQSTFNLSRTITQVLSILSPATNNAQANIMLQDDLNIPINSLESELTQVLMNIIKNALDALKEKEGARSVWIHAYQELESIYIVIRDNAGGIKEADLEKIFDPYFSTKQAKNGMGLGLYMSKLIIQKHCQGTLQASNDDQGAVLTITLPQRIQP